MKTKHPMKTDTQAETAAAQPENSADAAIKTEQQREAARSINRQASELQKANDDTQVEGHYYAKLYADNPSGVVAPIPKHLVKERDQMLKNTSKGESAPRKKDAASHTPHSFDDLTKQDWYEVQEKLIGLQRELSETAAERDKLREQVATVRELRELDTKAWKAREAELLQILQRETGHDYVWNGESYDQTD
jgi:hypothetical protein